MAGVDSKYLDKHKKFRADRKKLAFVALVAALLVATIVFWWLKLIGITVTVEAFCGLDEHTHDESCYTSELICGFEQAESSSAVESATSCQTEAESVSEGTVQTETSTAAHIHTDECCEKTLVCTLTEHVHTSECFPDKTADTETSEDWIKSFAEVELGDSVPENLAAIAATQLGYEESELNFEYDSNGIKKGYTRYGEWYGNAYGNWNAMFVSFCLNYSNAQQAEELFSSNAITMYGVWQEAGLAEAAQTHTAESGELIFLDFDEDGEIDSVGIVSEVTDGEIKVIIGDVNDCVEEITVAVDTCVIGYGLTGSLTVVQEETYVSEETTAEGSSDEDGHTHGDECYTSDGVLVCTEWGVEEPWALDWESDEFRDKAVKYVSFLINQLPELNDFENELSEYEQNEDYDAYEEYYTQISFLVSKAFVNYENLLEDLKEAVINPVHLFEYEWLYNAPSVMAVTETRTVEFVNYYDSATSNKTVLIHSGNVGTYSSFGFYWWYAVVVDENEYGELVVTDKCGYELTNKSSLAPTTENGFVLLSHGDGNSFDCSIGDEVTVDFDYLSASGKNTSGFGTVTFSEYVAPEETTDPDDSGDSDDTEESEGDPVVEDVPVSDINDGELSDPQVKDAGGKTTSGAGDVEISKTIDGTDIENVFDITLTIRTESNMQTYLADPDMAVVIVMDISNTMNAPYPETQTSTTRYDAAVVAAENFINQFAEKTKGISTLGFVAFNTHAHKILSLQTCTTANAASLISEIKTDTANIINNYTSEDKSRFTNVEGGLKMGYDMLSSSDNENKYIIFLSDGFPTTYLVSNSSNNTSSYYEGYNPYTSSGTKGADGVFYDYVTGYYCSYGTSYSDKASIKAREMATDIKDSGAKIFSIGIDVGGQTIAGYDGRTGLSVIDRTSTTYEIGDANSTAAYQNWLKNSIGSGYYYDSTNQSEITAAFNDIFAEIENFNNESHETVWTTTDPLPVLGEKASVVELIYFYDKDGNPVSHEDETDEYKYINGEFGENLENTAYYENRTVYWDLKKSGYETYTSEDGDTTYYFYKITYRVRLCNENDGFVEYTDYSTNGDAYLEYKTITTTDDSVTVSDNKVLYFEKPAVEGYYEELVFSKQSNLGEPVAGAVFVLRHDDLSCPTCKGNGEPIDTVDELGPFASAEDGTVLFTTIPSGHTYILEETQVPDGYSGPDKIYKVTVAMDEVSVTVYESVYDTVGTLWSAEDTLVIVNQFSAYILPETGGAGTAIYIITGVALMSVPLLYITVRRRKESRYENT